MTHRSFPIRAYVGPNGGGKTLAAVEQVVLPAWRRGRKVVSNLTLMPEVLGFDPVLYEPLESWRDISSLRSCELLLDEISSALPSRQAHSVPPELMRVLNQLRKGDVRCTWTAPDWGRADVALRSVTQAVTLCRGSFPERWERDVPLWGRIFPRAVRWGDDVPAIPAGSIVAPKDYKPPRPGDRKAVDAGWPPNRFFTFTTYDAVRFDEFTLSLTKKLRRESVHRYWRTSGQAMHVYRTLEAVALLDHLDDVGTCVVCGGRRSRPACSCGKPARQAPSGAGGRARAEGRESAGVAR